jgi:pyridoxine 5-phosphate synthase
MASLVSTVRITAPLFGQQVTHFSANINRIALLRNSRDNGLPDLLHAAKTILDAGADGITVHPRPDERHIRMNDITPLAALLAQYPDREFNIEGNPHHNLMAIVEAALPHQATFVPDAVGVSTSNRGFAAGAEMHAVQPLIARLKSKGVRVSVFVDADISAVDAAHAAGADRIELYTEPYAAGYAAGGSAGANEALQKFVQAAARARELGLGVNAGHDLNLHNLPDFIAKVVPDEVSIGHALIADALWLGLDGATRRYLSDCRSQ